MPNTTFAKDQLKSIIERIENLEAAKKETADDIRDVYSEAKSNGYDVKALRTIVRMRKMDADERREQQDVLDVYLNALGMLPLFERAERGDDTKVTISGGGQTVGTTVGGMKRATAALNRRAAAS